MAEKTTDSITITLSSEEANTILDLLGKLREEQVYRLHSPLDILYLRICGAKINHEKQIRAAQAPTYTRVQVLRMEWEPKLGDFVFAIRRTDGFIFESYTWLIKHVAMEMFCYAPTRELAEELSQVIKNIWQPKDGDEVYSYCTICRQSEGTRIYPIVPNEHLSAMVFFPSEPQRANYIKTREAERVNKAVVECQKQIKAQKEEKAKEEKKPKLFFVNGGVIRFGGGMKDGKNANYEHVITEMAVDQFNAMLNFCREKGGMF